MHIILSLTFLNIFPVFPRSSTPRACIVLQNSPACVSCSLIASNLDISQHLAIYVSTITFLNFFSTAVHDIHLLNVMFSQLAPCPKVRPSLSLIFEQNVTYYGFIKYVYGSLRPILVPLYSYPVMLINTLSFIYHPPSRARGKNLDCRVHPPVSP